MEFQRFQAFDEKDVFLIYNRNCLYLSFITGVNHSMMYIPKTDSYITVIAPYANISHLTFISLMNFHSTKLSWLFLL